MRAGEVLWNVKAKYIVLCLNALAKLQNPKGVSRPPALMGYYSVVCISEGGWGGGVEGALKTAKRII